MVVMNNIIYCAIYARVSTDRQGESVFHQVSLLREIAKRRGEGSWVIKDEFIYEDEGVSATKYSIWERPAMKRLLADAEQNKIQVILFKGISRFARNTQEALDMLDRLKAKGLRIISEEENYDSAKENSNFMFTMHAAIAEYEAEKISVRIRLGMKEKAKKGEWCGGRISEGYTIGDHGKILIDEARRHIIELIFDLYVNKKMGTTKIAEYLNKQGIKNNNNRRWNQLKISRILKNQIYIGNLIYNKGSFKHIKDYESDRVGRKRTIRQLNKEDEWILVENNHPAIISNEVFHLAQKKLKNSAKKTYAKNARHPLTGVVYCGKCGKAMNVMKRNTKYGVYRYYMCSSVIHYGRSSCDQPNINANKLEEFIFLKLKEKLGVLRNDERFWEKYTEIDADTTQLQMDLRNIEKDIEKNKRDTADLYFKRETMTNDQYQYIQIRLKDEAIQLKDRQKEAKMSLESVIKGATSAETSRKAIDDFFNFNSFELEQRRDMFQRFIEKITLADKNMEIKTKINMLVLAIEKSSLFDPNTKIEVT